MYRTKLNFDNTTNVQQYQSQNCFCKIFRHSFYNLKISQNVNYIKSNKTRILNQLKKVVKKRPLKVCFYVYDGLKKINMSTF